MWPDNAVLGDGSDHGATKRSRIKKSIMLGYQVSLSNYLELVRIKKQSVNELNKTRSHKINHLISQTLTFQKKSNLQLARYQRFAES